MDEKHDKTRVYTHHTPNKLVITFQEKIQKPDFQTISLLTLPYKSFFNWLQRLHSLQCAVQLPKIHVLRIAGTSRMTFRVVRCLAFGENAQPRLNCFYCLKWSNLPLPSRIVWCCSFLKRGNRLFIHLTWINVDMSSWMIEDTLRRQACTNL